jgi:hypothetical protein
MYFCEYKNLLGELDKGIHSHFMGIAIFDVLMTIVGAFIISYGFNINFSYTLLILFLLGVILHKIFCVKTTIDLLITNIF